MLDAVKNNRGTLNGGLLTGILVTAVLYLAREIFIPLALAALLSFLLTPAATSLERWRLPKTPAALLVIVLALAGAGAVGWSVVNQIYNLAVDLPQYQQNLTQKLESLHLNSAGRLNATVVMFTNVGKELRTGSAAETSGQVATSRHRADLHRDSKSSSTNTSARQAPTAPEEPAESMLSIAGQTLTPLLHPLETTFIMAIFLVFMLVGRDNLRNRGLRLAGVGRMHITTTAIEEASRRVSRYLQMQLVVNVSYGTAVGLALWAIGVPSPFLWGVLTCMLRFIPYVGILMAAAGPLILSLAVSPHWWQLFWTALTFLALEVVAGNFLEPMLYGVTTGVSPIAILIAAMFWTALWGFAGLLLATPLTVCLIVIGRQIPQLQFLDVLFGEDTVLSISERFYQRMLALKPHDAVPLLESALKTGSRAEAYDSIVIPALSLVEEARHSEELTNNRAEAVLLAIEDLTDDSASREVDPAIVESHLLKRIACVPGRDYADEVACRLMLQVLKETVSVHVMSADCSTTDILSSLEELSPDAICVIGIPPGAIRYIRLRCQQIRRQFPDALVVACLPSSQNDLSNLRSRIPPEDAQHVAGSLVLLGEYLTSLLCPDKATPQEARLDLPEQTGVTAEALEATHDETVRVDLCDGPEEEIFNRLVASLARSFDAPIALITAADGQKRFWEAQCGLSGEATGYADADYDSSIRNNREWSDCSVVIMDPTEDARFANDPFLKANGIRFYAGAPLKTHDDLVIGSLSVLDTRPRQATEEQRQALISYANDVMMAIQLRETATEEPAENPAEAEACKPAAVR